MSASSVTTGTDRRSHHGPALFAQGFRPFFLAAGLLATTALPLWMLQFLGAVTLPGIADPLAWHIHEMLFGYLGAALAGFLLTAIPNWTGRLPLAGIRLALLFALWLAGRAAMLTNAEGIVGGAVATAFPVVLALVVWREVIAGGNWRNAPVCLLVSALAAAQAVFLFVDQGLGTRLGLAIAALTILLIGGRVVPSFTGNWLRKQHSAHLPAPFGRYDRVTLALSLAALAAWIAWPSHPASGAALAAAALANAGRLARWQGQRTLAEPLLTVLHLGYAWVPVGLALMAGAILAPTLFGLAQAEHALGAGAIGLMTLAIMTRASLGHSGRPLHADAATVAAYVLVFLSAAMRVAAGWLDDPLPLYHIATACWTGGFAVFVARYAPILLSGKG